LSSFCIINSELEAIKLALITFLSTLKWQALSRCGVVVRALASTNVVYRHWTVTQLVLRWVAICWQVNHLTM